MKGTAAGTGLIEQGNFDNNIKEVKNAYEEHLLSCGEFDERMFLNEDEILTGTYSSNASPSHDASQKSSAPSDNFSNRPIRRNLVQVNINNSFSINTIRVFNFILNKFSASKISFKT